MYANYQIVDYNTRVTLGNTNASTMAASVLADLVGLLTGTVTNVNQLSAYADKGSCFIQGTSGNWSVWDTDAHSSYPGIAKVLRRLCADGLNYQYLFLAFRTQDTDSLNGGFGVMGGWNTATKAPTTAMKLSDNTQILSGVPVTSTNLPLTVGSTLSGAINSFSFSTQASQTRGSIPYKILNTPALLSIWPESIVDAVSFPLVLIAEYAALNPWSNSLSGATPVVYTTGNHSSTYQEAQAPYIKNIAGNLVAPSFVNLTSVAGNLTNSGSTSSPFNAPSSYIYDYGRNESGNKVIPVLPIDVTLRVSTSGYFCYAGRMRELFATLPNLGVSDTFTIGADTYVVIPTGAYSQFSASYSATGKVCAKIQ